MKCPACTNPLYDPQDCELAAECAWCGLVIYSEDRGYYRGTGPQA